MGHSEFLLTLQYLRTKHERPDIEHYYLAQIAREVRVVLYKAADAKKNKINDFLITFEEKTPPKKEKTVEVPIEESIERKTKVSQSFWFALTGFRRNKESTNGKKNSARRAGRSSNRKRKQLSQDDGGC